KTLTSSLSVAAVASARLRVAGRWHAATVAGARGRHGYDQPFVAFPCAAAVGCDCRLRASDPTSAWVVGTHTHCCRRQIRPRKKRSKIVVSFPRCTTTIKNHSQAND
ncbi:hypothetical protein GW17_00058092, partial [Ensete ventricosum]